MLYPKAILCQMWSVFSHGLKSCDTADRKLLVAAVIALFKTWELMHIQHYFSDRLKWTNSVPSSADTQGWVSVSGVICPFLYAAFRVKRVNNEKIWLLPRISGSSSINCQGQILKLAKNCPLRWADSLGFHDPSFNKVYVCPPMWSTMAELHVTCNCNVDDT